MNSRDMMFASGWNIFVDELNQFRGSDLQWFLDYYRPGTNGGGDRVNGFEAAYRYYTRTQQIPPKMEGV